jgi:hypothetical protein
MVSTRTGAVTREPDTMQKTDIIFVKIGAIFHFGQFYGKNLSQNRGERTPLSFEFLHDQRPP